MVVEALSIVFAAGGVFLKLADFGGMPPSAEQEMYAARILLDSFNNTVSEVQSSRDRLAGSLTPIKKHQIDQHLQIAYSISEAYENALKHRIVADEILQFGERAAWVFRDKRKVETYQGGLGMLQTTLERLCEDMARLEAAHTDSSGGEKPPPRRHSEGDAAHVAAKNDTKCFAEPAGNLEDERFDSSPGTASESIGDAIQSGFKLETSISADLMRRYERKPIVLPPPPIPASITADLERRFAQRNLTTAW